jgi:L-alanine-DL-glutamate epimerase-like enolase superfamily enzyme
MGDLYSEKIVQIEKVVMKFKRPRLVGCNARIGTHGDTVTDRVVRIHTDSGAVGVGWSRLGYEEAEALVGKVVGDLFRLPDGSNEAGAVIDLPLWDLAAKVSEKPLYQLLGARGSRAVELYDGSIYIDDLDASDEEAVAIFQDEVKMGHEYGYKNFKIKMGRGARWMPVIEGTDRDVLVIHTVREAAGPDAKILIDANNGTTLNIAKDILERCEDVGIYWFEEPFPEDKAFNEAFKAFIDEKGYDTLVADGESGGPPLNYFDLVENGWINVVQPDFHSRGLTWWRETAAMIEPWGALCGPHTWGSVIERYCHAHFAASVPHYTVLEAAPVDMPGIVLGGWEMKDGCLIVPDTPGTGFDLESEVIEEGVRAEGGFRIDRG